MKWQQRATGNGVDVTWSCEFFTRGRDNSKLKFYTGIKAGKLTKKQYKFHNTKNETSTSRLIT